MEEMALPAMARRVAISRIEVTMSFVVAAILAVCSFVLYLAGERMAFGGVCRYALDLCQHPMWPLYVAIGVVAVGLLFRVNRI